jgi:perosamine synthetase
MCHAEFALAVANGTVALHLALLGFDLKPGDEVILPSLTYVATANAVRYVGARPVFVDVDRATWCVSPQAIEEAITPRTRGVIVVHLYGHPADMDAIQEIASRHGLWIVEDAAEAHTATYKGRVVGGLADVSVFSFYGNKIFTSGEGGAVVINNPQQAAKLRMLRGQGMDPNRRYYFPIVGYNYRLTNISAALLCAQLERAADILAWRRKIFQGYRDRLLDESGLGFQPRADWAEPAPWLFCLTVDEAVFGRSRDDLVEALDGEGVETRPFFIPLHTLPPYRDDNRETHLPVTDKLARSGLNLPTHRSITSRNLDRICDVVRKQRR